jgi:hypothetical protein
MVCVIRIHKGYTSIAGVGYFHSFCNFRFLRVVRLVSPCQYHREVVRFLVLGICSKMPISPVPSSSLLNSLIILNHMYKENL